VVRRFDFAHPSALFRVTLNSLKGHHPELVVRQAHHPELVEGSKGKLTTLRRLKERFPKADEGVLNLPPSGWITH
jgi:hypothetical protein